MLPWDCDSLQRVKPIILKGEGKQRHWIGARTRGDFSSNLFWLFGVFPVSLRIFVLFRLCTNWIWNDWNIYLICALKVCISLTEPDAFQGGVGAGETCWRGVKKDGSEVQDGAEAAGRCNFLPEGTAVESGRLPQDFGPRWVLWKSWFSWQQIPGLMCRWHLLDRWEQGPLQAEWGHSAMEPWPLLSSTGRSFPRESWYLLLSYLEELGGSAKWAVGPPPSENTQPCCSAGSCLQELIRDSDMEWF